ncbi:hypothetical protein SEA_IBANTIK_91 [Streptomyces phage Ibantik]|uniref:Uncharacterized protein n=1 Tax=Streptomyces phage Ibantik TaxID=2182397 RepID=A0A2U8UNX2_9CAUD|nr:hypothetical protein QEH36_gp074 [Streptomyces phage Ibantik]AWN05313.1 hypothetical protein SEA_IBANTIK_91 [Streptomyces phage Ibantik]
MSLMKRYKEDCDEFQLRAVGIVWNPSKQDREELITELFEDCGTAASVYADPASVCALFVNLVSETYAAEFMVQREAV